MKIKNISHFIMMGDSLSDRGTMNHRYLFYFIPMSILSGLAGHSPRGRFTNGYAWSDHIATMLANQFMINELKEKLGMDSGDIADAIIAKDARVMALIRNDYSLDDDGFIQFEGRDFVRSYDEGGLTAHDYSWTLSKSLGRFFSRIILSTLTQKREELLAYDRENPSTKAHKAETLIIEWSGANDLITVNAGPSAIEVDRAVEARIANVRKLVRNGYQNFILFNLPDLSLTPRYQNKTGPTADREREEAHRYSNYFNSQLATEVARLQSHYPQCSIQVFDISSIFDEVHENPEAYGFETAKRKQPFQESADFVLNGDNTSPAKGYMFWDDVHPTADLHALLAERFYRKFRFQYNFKEPASTTDEEFVEQSKFDLSEDDLRAAFITRYRERLVKDQQSFFGHFKHAGFDYRNASLEEILTHALYEGGERTRKVIIDLQWIDKQGHFNLNSPVLREAFERMVVRSQLETQVMEND